MTEVSNILSRSEEETLDIGMRIGKSCTGGECISLVGPLGSGKSVLTRGIARGLGITGTVRSPSFNLMREYAGRLTLKHWDLYRLEGGYRELGLLESVDGESVVVIEWAERWNELESFSTGIIKLDYGEEETHRSIRIGRNVPGFNGEKNNVACD